MPTVSDASVLLHDAFLSAHAEFKGSLILIREEREMQWMGQCSLSLAFGNWEVGYGHDGEQLMGLEK